MNDEIRQRLQTLRDGLSVQSGQFERLPTAAEIVELIDCVLAVEPVVNNVSITNNRAAEDRVGESCANLAPGSGAAARMGIDLVNRAIQEAARDIHRAMGPLADHCICGQRWDSHDKAQCKPPGYKPPRWWQFWRAA